MFDLLFIRVHPAYLQNCNQIVVLSVSAAVTASLETHMAERLTWLEIALGSLDAEVSLPRDDTPKPARY